jgi:iron complex transport system substrate-binding protein
MKARRMLLPALLFAASIGACTQGPKGTTARPTLVIAESADRLTCRDADGVSVIISKHPRRTIVNYVSLVGLWYQAGGTAVGIPDTNNVSELPEAARGIATTGRVTAPNAERILSLEPTLVILAADMERQRALKDILEGAGIETLTLSYGTYADYLGILDLFYRLNGSAIPADSSAAAAANEIEALCSLTRARPATSFLSIFASTIDVQAETDKAHTAYMASCLGAKNIVASPQAIGSASRVTMSLERIHMDDPDVIFVTTMGDSGVISEKMRKDFMESDSWKSLRAVREGRVHFLPSELFLYKPNARFPEAFRMLAAYLHPGIR